MSTNTARAIAVRSACTLLLAIGTLHGAAAQDSAASSAAPAATEQEAAPARTSARVRLFGQNGVLVEFFQNSTCVGGGQKTSVSGGMGDAFSSFAGRAKNISIGMKETPNTENLAKRDGFMSKAYFREYEVAGNQPITLKMHFRNTPGKSLVCRNVGGTFTPEAGKDYEVAMDIHSDGCVASVQEIGQDAQGKVLMQDIKVEPAAVCK